MWILDQVQALAGARRAAVAVEFALLTPFLFTLTVGIVNYADLTNYRIGLDQGIRAAISLAAISPPIDGNVSHLSSAFDYAAPQANNARTLEITTFCQCPDGEDVNCTSGCADGDRQSFVHFSINETYVFLIPSPIANEMPITHQMTLRVS